jgi:hypothetical protein
MIIGVVIPLSLAGVWKPLVGYSLDIQDLKDFDELFVLILNQLKTMNKEEFNNSLIVDNFTVCPFLRRYISS